MSEPELYLAFFSYSHNDKEIVESVYKQFETYEIPNYLRKRNPRLQKNLTPVFWDEERLELGKITENIKKALRKTENLIVFCSKDSVQSSWVKKEIKLFREYRQDADNHIIPILLQEPETNMPLNIPPGIKKQSNICL